jgi:ABC-2 type transport system ATP-binding protein
MNPIVVDNVVKRYGDFTAVDGISFEVRRGRIFGLLGPNGAGKTTTIRMIMNIIMPDEGKVSVLGRPASEESSRFIGYLPEERGLYRKMKVMDHLVFLGEIRGLRNAESKKRSGEWLERVGLSDRAGKKVEELSKGMQQKIQFIGCVIHDPEVLILDEPFSGLDPVNARVLKDLLAEFKAQGKTLVFSTHIMEQAEKLCDEIALINSARVVLRGDMVDIKRQFSGNRLILRGQGDIENLRGIAGVESIIARDGAHEVELGGGLTAAPFLRAASQLYEIESANPHEVSLDEIFVQVVGAPIPVIEAERGVA